MIRRIKRFLKERKMLLRKRNFIKMNGTRLHFVKAFIYALIVAN